MRRFAVVVVGAVLLVGCATVSGTPAADTSSAELFQPCDIPDDALIAAGVDPVEVGSDYFGVEAEDWDLCTWAGSWYFLTVLATTHSFGEIKANPRSVDIVPVQVGDRNAVSYASSLFADRVLCDVAFPWAKGSVVVRVDQKLSEPKAEDTCAVALRASNTLDAALPL